jgi:phage/plasmid-associated DNA primase
MSRFGSQYKFVKNVGICKYNNGIYKVERDGEFADDISKTLQLTWYEFNYLTNSEKTKNFQKLYKKSCLGEPNTISGVEKRIKKRLLYINTKPTDFDNEEYNVINFNNGFYDLDRQTLFPHSPHHLFLRK